MSIAARSFWTVVVIVAFAVIGLGCSCLPPAVSAHPPAVVFVMAEDKVFPDPVYVRAGKQEAHWFGCGGSLVFDPEFRALFVNFRCNPGNHCWGVPKLESRRATPYQYRVTIVSAERSASIDPGMIVW